MTTQSDFEDGWAISGIVVYKKRLNLVSVRATDLILDVKSWARDIIRGQENLAENASTHDLKCMFEANAQILRGWAEGDIRHGADNRFFLANAPYLAARAALGYHEVRPSNFLSFMDNVVMRRAVPAEKGDSMAFIFVADPGGPEIHTVYANDYLVRNATSWIRAQVWSQQDFDSLCRAAAEKFPSATAADNADSNRLTPNRIGEALMQGLESGVMPPGLKIGTSQEKITKRCRISKNR